MKVVTHDDIININKLYKELKTYAAVSRATGFAPSTVKKYIQEDFKIEDEKTYIRFNHPLPEFDSKIFRTDDWSDLCLLSEEEEEAIHELWGELDL